MLVPFSDRLDDWRIEPEEIDALVAEFQYVQQLPEVDPKRVGFFGASVGGSLALVAAGDPRIADEVDHVVSFGGYFDALETFGAIADAPHRVQGVDEAWTPRAHAEHVMAQQLIDARRQRRRPRTRSTSMFIDDEQPDPASTRDARPRRAQFVRLLIEPRPRRGQSLIARLPAEAVRELDYLSPRTSIDNVKAELFIIHDRADPFIPYTESRKLQDAHAAPQQRALRRAAAVRAREPKLDQGPDIVALDSTRLLFRLYQLLLRWDCRGASTSTRP